MDYHIVRERDFSWDDLRGFEEVVEMLQQWQWVSFNDLIQNTNKTIGLEFYANVAFSDVGSYTSYCKVSISTTLLVLLIIFWIFNLLLSVVLGPIEMRIML